MAQIYLRIGHKEKVFFFGDANTRHKDRGCYNVNTFLLLDSNISRDVIHNCTTLDSCSPFLSRNVSGIMTLES